MRQHQAAESVEPPGAIHCGCLRDFGRKRLHSGKQDQQCESGPLPCRQQDDRQPRVLADPVDPAETDRVRHPAEDTESRIIDSGLPEQRSSHRHDEKGRNGERARNRAPAELPIEAGGEQPADDHGCDHDRPRHNNSVEHGFQEDGIIECIQEVAEPDEARGTCGHQVPALQAVVKGDDEWQLGDAEHHDKSRKQRKAIPPALDEGAAHA
ncbi:hypothetical protein ABIE78_003736 [Sinorhizobium fredii]